MKIEVKNFGKIKKGQIDLDKKVTVFVGYNNTGKTYMSQLLWGLFTNRDWFYLTKQNLVTEELIKDGSLTITTDLVSKLMGDISLNLSKSILPELFNVKLDYFHKENFTLRILDLFQMIKSISFNLLIDKRPINDHNLMSGYFYFEKKEDSLAISLRNRNFSESLNYQTGLKKMNEEIGDQRNWYLPNINLPMPRLFDYYLINLIEIIVFGDKKCIPFFLPANRQFFPTFYKYIYSVAKEEKDKIDTGIRRLDAFDAIIPFSKKPYTKALDDNLIRETFKLNIEFTGFDLFSDLIDELKEILGGDVIIKSSEGIAPIEFFLKLDNGKELDMYMASSSANQLATLYLYFKYWTFSDNNFLIIDEPEENLHPENQIKLVNILMKFADRNNKVLITTHSPLIADLINNYANLSYLKEAGTDVGKLIAENKFEMYPVQNILHKDYGIYFFNGDSIKEYDVNEYGAYFKDFQVAEDKVKNMSNILRGNIYENINRK